MIDIFTDCELVNLSENELIFDFDCNDRDLNDFLFVFSTEQQEKENLQKSPNNDAPLHTRQMFFDLMRLV